MDILWKSVGDAVVLRFIGDFDAYELAKAGPRIDNLIEQGHRKLVFNLRRLTFINSSALGFLVRTKKHLVAEGGDVVLSQPARFARKALTVLGLHEYFHVFESDEDALSHFHPEGGAEVVRLDDGEVDDQLLGENSILFRLLDEKGKELFGPTPMVGKISSLYMNGLAFRWKVPAVDSHAPLNEWNLSEHLHPGRLLYAKFRQPFVAKTKYFEAICEVKSVNQEVYDSLTDEARIDIDYRKIDPEDKAALDRFVEDLEGFRNELK